MKPPKEFADELVREYWNIDNDSNGIDDFNMTWLYAKRCAIIHVKGIIEQYDTIETILPIEFF